MRSDEKTRFVQVLAACLDAYGRERSDAVMALWWKLLQPYPADQVEEAIANHMRTSRFAPVPADIITRLQASDGRPTAEEAWAMVPRSEYDSVIWTEEMAQAFGIAAGLLEHGDQVAARKAFIDRYESLVAKARSAGEPMKVTPSFGFDVAGREVSVQKAVERGLIPLAKAQLYIGVKPTADGLALVSPAVKALQ